MPAAVGFDQARIKVGKEQEFEGLKGIIEQAFSAREVEGFLKRVQARGLRIRDLDLILAAGLLDRGDEAGPGRRAQAMYAALPVSDQGQLREFYLEKLEQVEPPLRHRFQKIYQYY